MMDDEPDHTIELCASCSKVDIFSLFTGPRYFPSSGYHESTAFGTLAEINTNTHCPFCRLLHHNLYTNHFNRSHVNVFGEEGAYIDPSKVQVNVRPIRADYFEEMKYANKETLDKVATILHVRLVPVEGSDLSQKEKSLILHHHRGDGIQLLSPDSVDSARPLKNGYPYSNTTASLELLRGWMETCTGKHTLETGKCRQPEILSSRLHEHSERNIRVIDVQSRTIVPRHSGEIEYAALSYVWSQAHGEIVNLEDPGATQGSSNSLPSRIPRVVEDAIFVCRKLSIPYLWVDRHCINQGDEDSRVREIQVMAFRYLHAKITLIAGGVLCSGIDRHEKSDTEIGLLPRENEGKGLQIIEKIQGRKYITALPSITTQIHSSQWHTRAWTMQEAQLASRCAFFGNFDVSFLCGEGHWRECLHSGPHGHDAKIEGIDPESKGHYMLSWPKWTKDKIWRFEDYHSLLMAYTSRKSTFESDRLNAVTGCLNFIGEAKGVEFFHGLPLVDFHYALLWIGEYDRPRHGFPSWSWPGWHCLQTLHNIYPSSSPFPSSSSTSTHSCNLRSSSFLPNTLETIQPKVSEAQLQGLFISLTERAHIKNKSSQRFANISIPSYLTSSILVITSEVAHFAVDIVASISKPEYLYSYERSHLDVPVDFDSSSPSSSSINWDVDKEYCTPYARLRLRDASGNSCQYHYPRWYDHPPPLQLKFPSTLRGGTLSWLLKEGIDLVMIVEIEVIEAEEGLDKFDMVLCLGIDRKQVPWTRMGVFCLPKETWERAGPIRSTVRIG